MPAGTSTRLQPVRHSSRKSMGFLPTSITYPVTLHFLSRWLKSAATPSGGTMATLRSKILSSLTFGSIPMSSERGWPMPPAPPQTQTLKLPAGLGSFTALALASALTLALALAFGSSLAFALALVLTLAFALAPSFALAFACLL